MKKLFYLSLIAVGCMFAFTACGDEAETLTNTVKDNASQIKDSIDQYKDQLSADVDIKMEGNKMILTTQGDSTLGVVSAEVVVSFNGDTCVGAQQIMYFPNDQIASMVYQGMMQGGLNNNLTLEGNKIIVNLDGQFAGLSKDAVQKLLIEYAKAETEEDEDSLPSDSTYNQWPTQDSTAVRPNPYFPENDSTIAAKDSVLAEPVVVNTPGAKDSIITVAMDSTIYNITRVR